MPDLPTTARTDDLTGDGSGVPGAVPASASPTGAPVAAADPFGTVLTTPHPDGALLEGEHKKKKKKNKDEIDFDPTDPDSLFEAMGPRRGVDTLFRTSYRVNMDLTSLADAKANIMISINGLMVSILIAAIAPKVDANPWLLVPTSVFLIGCLVSLIFAVLSARPRVQSHAVTLEESRRHHTNILFFGNFAHLSESDFMLAMKERMMDPVALYGMMISDIYGVGSVLQRKYRLLRASYGAFIVALVVGVVGFIAIFGYAAFFQSGPTIVTTPAGTTSILSSPVDEDAVPIVVPAPTVPVTP